VVEASDQKIRRFHLGGYDSQLVIATGSGEIGFLLDDPSGWAVAVSEVRSRLPAPGAP